MCTKQNGLEDMEGGREPQRKDSLCVEVQIEERSEEEGEFLCSSRREEGYNAERECFNQATDITSVQQREEEVLAVGCE